MFIWYVYIYISNKMSKKIKCQRCQYEWNTESQRMFVSCPRCLTKVKVMTFEQMIGKNKMEDNL